MKKENNNFIIPIILLAGAAYLIKRFFKKEIKSMDILKERYAKGEISKDEFENKKNDLM